jgi:hypothetical protein
MDARPAEDQITVLAERVVRGLDALAELGEAVEDEQQYVRDLVLAWTARLRAVAATATEGHRPTPVGATTAVRVLLDASARITDPQRAIDWLSSLPAAAVLALGDAP